MSGYLNLLLLVLPVFLLLGIGVLARWRQWLSAEVEKGVIQLVVNVFYPCLIVRAMVMADDLGESQGALWAPVVGFGSVALGFVISYWIGLLFRMKRGQGLRTFAFSAGIYNYGYLPIPLVEGLFGKNELAVLFVHNVGIEIAIWTVGISFLAGGSWRDGMRKIINPMVAALAVGLALNMNGGAVALPAPALTVLSLLASCAVPLGLMAIGASLFDHMRSAETIWHPRDCLLGAALRLGLLPLIGIVLIVWAPLPIELKRVLAVQAAMPAGIMPILFAKHYGGQPIVAVRVVFASTAIGFLSMPFWIQWGLSLVE